MSKFHRGLTGLAVAVLFLIPAASGAAILNQHSFTWWDDPAQGVIITPLGAANKPTLNATQLLNLKEWHVDQAQTQAWYAGGANPNLPASPFNAANRIGLIGAIVPVAGAEGFIYEISNINYGSGNGFSFSSILGGINGLSGINIIDDGGALLITAPAPVSQFMFNAGILDLTPGSLGGPQDWDFNTFAGPGNFEWDISPAVPGPGSGPLPNQSAVFGFAMPGQWSDRVNDGWVHSWNVAQENIANATGGFSGPTPIPEPGSLAIFGLGLAGLGLMRRRRKA